MSVPKVRAEIAVLAARVDTLVCELTTIAGRLSALVPQLRRNKPKRPRPPAATPMTPAMRRRIIAERQARPDATQLQIATRLNINPGRVSEVLSKEPIP